MFDMLVVGLRCFFLHGSLLLLCGFVIGVGLLLLVLSALLVDVGLLMRYCRYIVFIVCVVLV